MPCAASRNATIKQLYNLGVEIEENSELDLFEAYNRHAGDERIPTLVKDRKQVFPPPYYHSGIP